MAPKAETLPEYEFHVDGTYYDLDDFSFAEQRELRSTIRELSGDEDAHPLSCDPMDKWPAMYWIVTKRTKPDYELEDALKLKYPDLMREVKKGRPTQARKRTSAQKTAAA